MEEGEMMKACHIGNSHQGLLMALSRYQYAGRRATWSLHLIKMLITGRCDHFCNHVEE
jgi:hypothetical protein